MALADKIFFTLMQLQFWELSLAIITIFSGIIFLISLFSQKEDEGEDSNEFKLPTVKERQKLSSLSSNTDVFTAITEIDVEPDRGFEDVLTRKIHITQS